MARITTKAWPGNGRTHPPLWDVLEDGTPIPGGRVLKMGSRYIPIYDPSPLPVGTVSSRAVAADTVAWWHEYTQKGKQWTT